MNITTTEGILEIAPFIHSPGGRFVRPFIWEDCINPRTPRRHDIEPLEDGTFKHRIVWRDNVGVLVTTTKKRVPARLLPFLHSESRLVCEEIEHAATGFECH